MRKTSELGDIGRDRACQGL